MRREIFICAAGHSGSTLLDMMLGWHRHSPAEYRIRVHYQDLVTNPAAESQSLCDFPGIEFGTAIQSCGAVLHHGVTGNDKKLSDLKSLKPGRGWRTQMTPGDLAYFERRAGRLNRQFGYQ